MEQIDALRIEAARLYAQKGKPLVTLSYAQSLDGSIARRRGEPLAISGADALGFTHRLRAAHEAILVGIGTILADDPRLSVRLIDGPQPQPVVLDTRLRTPPDARVLKHAKAPWIITAAPLEPRKEAALISSGARIISLPSNADYEVDLPALLAFLGGEGICSLMVEGGARVITAFLRENLVDQLVLTLAPVLVGGLHALEAPLDLPRLRAFEYQACGEDIIVWGKLK